MPKVAIYVRVSTDHQAEEGFSLDAQLHRVKAYVRSKGWEVFGEYIEKGQSARTIDRPEYLRMMEESEGWDILAIWKLDRIHRDSLNFTKMIKALNKADKGFVSVYENFDSTTIYGKFAMDVIMRLAQLESERLGERVLEGMTQKAKEGGHLGSAPFGYRFNDDGELELSEDSDVVRSMFIMRFKGETFEGIAYHFNLNGVKTLKGKAWDKRKVSKIIHNPIYAGYVRFNGNTYKGKHKPIVPLSLWESLNDDV